MTDIPSYWMKPKKVEIPMFTDMELALMEGGQSIEQEIPKSSMYSFLKYVTEPTLKPTI